MAATLATTPRWGRNCFAWKQCWTTSHCPTKRYWPCTFFARKTSIQYAGKHGPVLLQLLYTGTGSKSIQFLKHIRNYDNSLAMASATAQLENPPVQAYWLIDKVAREGEQRAIEAQRTQRPVRMVFCQLNTDHHRRYNIATANEVAVVYVGNNEEIPGKRYVVVYERGQGLRTISYLDKLFDPLSYSLLFPRGEDGWHPDMEKIVTGNNRRTRVTQKELYSYLLFARTGTFNPLLHAGKLSQQYVVDSWLKIEVNRLNYLRKNQKELRWSTPYDCIKTQYQDAMSIVSKYGKPDVFLTLTCNPNWREIQNNLEGGKNYRSYLDVDVAQLDQSEDQVDHEDHRRIGQANYNLLTNGKKLFVNDVLSAIDHHLGQCFFIDGPRGSGKTFVYTAVYHMAKARKKQILNVAWTGIAANFLPDGRTASSAFRLVVEDLSRISSIKRQSEEARFLSKIDVIIWDEIPMTPKQALEAVNALLQDIMQNSKPSGGKIMLLEGTSDKCCQ
ncbi:unnamed protein product [Heligmosomoides polygyrus]|uniref:ATP-dependent DNA helicase n=1 Tax=Heligmosomoides polygyrus TaxID=6339 RepID=A0A183GGB6_HELPZ|nr:unnamed protein product [Heligmosomoides polygyrus]